jgi:hypothetical protein
MVFYDRLTYFALNSPRQLTRTTFVSQWYTTDPDPRLVKHTQADFEAGWKALMDLCQDEVRRDTANALRHCEAV